MKKIVSLLALLFMCSFAKSQPHIYFNFISHNEETSQWNGNPFYTANRLKLISLTNYFQSKGITWNMQSDWVYLSNVLSKETTTLMTQTNNKNILRWMHEDMGVEMDPHAHESVYIYPDVVKLMDSIGLPESKVIGGTIYNDSNGVNIWTNLVNGQNGIIFPAKFWKPTYMMGGGTPNHVADLKYYGLWNPQSITNYLTNDTSVHLTHLGVGCEMKIKDTTTVAPFVANLRDLVLHVQNGFYPANGFYIQTIFFEQADLNTLPFYNKLIEIADSANAIVTGTNAEWKTFKQAYTIWETTYAKQMFQWECGQMATDVSDINANNNELILYPNPASTILDIAINRNSTSGIQNSKIEIYNVLGQLVYSPNFGQRASNIEIDISHFTNGIYFVKNGNIVVKFLKE